MKNKLLKDNVYLTLLAFYRNQKMPSYSELGRKIGLTRQTVSTRVKKLIQDKIIELDEDNNVIVLEEIDVDKDLLRQILTETPNIDVVDLNFRLNGQLKEVDSVYDLSDLIDVPTSTIYANKNSECVVYGIVSEGVVKYVGSTKHYQERIKEHIWKRPFLTSNNFIILKRVELNERFSYEGVLIKILKPEWNIMGV